MESTTNQNTHSRFSSSLFLLLVGLTTLLTGCGVLKAVGLLSDTPDPELPPSQIPYEFAITLKAGKDLNANSQAQPSPIRLRLFLAEASDNLDTETFETLFEYGGAKTPVDPVAVVVLTPNTTKTVKLVGKMSQDQLFIAAAFHDVHSAQWLATKSINTRNPGTITAIVHADTVVIQ
ncbi:MAG: type VI secretion system lipoprotein TssJ [Granulosicoccus sp.]|nr:type VI secretion system lipoprotein TssJ [Granulosicoccus sp.]